MSGNTNTDILLAGAVAAFMVDLLVYPFDTLKTRLQSPDYSRLFVNSSTKTVNRSLFRGLYQGVGSVIVATLPSSGAFFTTYEGAKSILTTYNPPVSSNGGRPLVPQPFVHSAASALAELVSCAILTPAEVIKQNAQMVRTGPNQPLTSATLQTMARFKGNPLALWRGYTALAGRNLPFTALQFPIFERLKEALKAWRDKRGTRTHTVLETGLITAASAGSAGSLAAVLTTPVDVVKTRIMLAAAEDAARDAGKQTISASSQHSSQGGNGLVDALRQKAKMGRDGLVHAASEVVTGSKKRQSSWAIGKEIVADQGLKGLWRGGALRAVWTMLGSGLYLGVYESGRIYLANRRGNRLEDNQEIL